ncbi:protein Atg16l2-like isoform X1 [Bufo gargarizans]|uniref:protein Atg16l2-like isoform X1 n=1 Tax=Bufo gargarizans TaxID=30331 RepID=UPI001CF3264E|nr:protein Atg16l2-like isoform X1 [Bufo gargarizans]
MQGAERRVRDPGGRAAWKGHIIRELRRRDRAQTGVFQELIQSYNKLLEKSVFLKDLTEKIQTEPVLFPGGHHAARTLPEGVHTAGSDASPTLQKEISALRDYNGELAFQACELKKEVQEREQELQQQRSSISFLAALVDDHKDQCQCLEKEMVQMVCANADLKEDYDHLLSKRLLLEGQLHEAEEEQRDLIEALTMKKVMEAEQQNSINERRKDEMWSRIVKKALRKTVSAEGIESDDSSQIFVSVCWPPALPSVSVALDVCQTRSMNLHDLSSMGMTGNQELEKSSPRTCRSQSMISLGPSRFMGALRSLFDFRKTPDDCSVDGEWYRPSPVCVICCPPKRAIYSKEVHDSEIHAVKFSPNSRMVATGGADRVVKIWDIVGGQLQCQQVLQGSNGGITSIEFDPSGVQVLAASFDGSAHLWKLDTKANDKMTGHTGKVTAAKFKMSTYRAVTCSMDRTVREWDLHKAACVRCIAVPSYCSDVVCSDSLVISGHHDKKIRFWDTRSQLCVREVTLEEKVTSLYMEPEQTQLLSCSRDDALTLLDLRTGGVRLVFRADGFKCGCDWTKAILSPDNSYSMAGSSDGTIFIWNTRTGLLERSLTGEHSTAVNAVAWSVSGDYVLSVDRGKKAVLWSEY